MTSENNSFGSTSFRSFLEYIVQSNAGSLKSAVSQILLDQTEDEQNLMGYIEDLESYGCVSGMVAGLIHFADTHAFYDKYYYEIEELRLQRQSEIGQVKVIGDAKNFFAWFAFEYTTFLLRHEWESMQANG